MRHRLVIFAVLAISFAAAAAALLRAQPAAFDPASDLASICTLETPFAPEVLGEARHRFEVAVPAINPLPGRADARTFVVVRGDVIQVRVDAPPRGGFVAVHGILEEHRVKPSGSIYVKLQAKYSGRFPLHFHGADGSHFEVAVFEVRPEP
ncbi:MAG TPA: hypothetical protein VHL79_21640 [Ramlibacter sp.]|jgi:hypothetical protein|nr:hypothetical protein [Ramlibacter sp.]